MNNAIEVQVKEAGRGEAKSEYEDFIMASSVEANGISTKLLCTL